MQDIINVFKALSEETRLRIIKLLEHGELCVCDIVAALDMIQPKISFHLAVLKEAGFIKDRKQGKWTHYRLDDSDMFRRFLLLSALERISSESVAEDRKRLTDFLETKSRKGKVVSIQKGSICCSRKAG
jgi:ArsR family transcriptional regulator, arsenate/arsenite/antimonite-responsive transcriptional repressor